MLHGNIYFILYYITSHGVIFKKNIWRLEQACILAVSSAEKRVVVNDGPDADENPFKVSSVMNVTLSSDHRVIDGATAAIWGQEFRKFIESPELMLL